MASDLEFLLEMGFDPDKAVMAVKQTGNLQGAIDWLDMNQSKSIEELTTTDPAISVGANNDEPGEKQDEAHSLVCNDCGKRFRGAAEAEFHASRTQHTDFAESKEEIKPLTEEEKEAKLAELRQRLSEKKARVSNDDTEDRRKNEQIRRKATSESQDIREELQKKERMKEAAKKRQEKRDEVDARRKVLAKVEADKAERRRKSEVERAARAGLPAPSASEAEPAAKSSAVASASAPSASTANETRLKLQISGVPPVTRTFPSDATLEDVATALEDGDGPLSTPVTAFSTPFPRRAFNRDQFSSTTLRGAGLVPSAVLIVR